MLENKENTVQEKLDFSMYLRCSKFMVSYLPHRDILTELLKNRQFICKNRRLRKSVSFSENFGVILNAICYKCNLILVEQIYDTASLYGHSLKGHHVCLLLKYDVSNISEFNIRNSLREYKSEFLFCRNLNILSYSKVKVTVIRYCQKLQMKS